MYGYVGTFKFDKEINLEIIIRLLIENTIILAFFAYSWRIPREFLGNGEVPGF